MIKKSLHGLTCSDRYFTSNQAATNHRQAGAQEVAKQSSKHYPIHILETFLSSVLIGEAGQEKTQLPRAMYPLTPPPTCHKDHSIVEAEYRLLPQLKSIVNMAVSKTFQYTIPVLSSMLYDYLPGDVIKKCHALTLTASAL